MHCGSSAAIACPFDRPVGMKCGRCFWFSGCAYDIAQQTDRLLLPRAALEDHPVVDRIDVAVPHDFEVPALLAFATSRRPGLVIETVTSPDASRSRDLRDRGPPDHVRLDRVELAKRAIDARPACAAPCRRPRAQRRPPSARIRACTSACCACRAGREIAARPRTRPSCADPPACGGVVAEQLRPHHRAHAAFVHRDVDVLLSPTEHRPIDPLEQALFAAEQQLFDLDLHDVPVVGAALHFRAQHADAAVPNVLDAVARRCAPRTKSSTHRDARAGSCRPIRPLSTRARRRRRGMSVRRQDRAAATARVATRPLINVASSSPVVCANAGSVGARQPHDRCVAGTVELTSPGAARLATTVTYHQAMSTRTRM